MVAACLLALGFFIWNTNTVQDLFAGPRIPLPRQASDFSLGMSKSEIVQRYPKIKKLFRSFNGDPLFDIATLDPKVGLAPGASRVDLLFFKDQLYFISATWENGPATALPVQKWVEDFKRWNPRRSSPAEVQNMGDQASLKEWNFADGKTEMTLRDLSYADHIQRWQDIRDAANEPAQAAFAKYRLETGS